MMNYKLGLLPSPQPPELALRSYLLPARLPPVPATFGHQDLYPRVGWGMLMNDRLGCCTVSGADHCVMLWNKICGKNVRITNLDVIDDYSAITGYVRGNAATDNGADMVAVAKFWQKTGFRDSRNHRHKIIAYLSVNPQNLERVYQAAYLFDAVGLGVKIPSSAERQFVDGRPWTNVSGDSIEGYHYVPLVGRHSNGNGVVITWGAAQEVEQSWLGVNLFECVAMISQEALNNGKSSEGFDITALQDDLAAIGDR